MTDSDSGADAHADDIDERLENRLMSHGVYVDEVDHGADELRLRYETVHATDGVPHTDIGRVINLLREFRDEGWDPVAVHGTATDLEGEELGSWHAEAEWFHELAADDITETDFSQRVLATIDES